VTDTHIGLRGRRYARVEKRGGAHQKQQQQHTELSRDRSGLRNVLGVIIMMIVVIAIYFPPPFNYLSSIIRAAAALAISVCPGRRARLTLCLYTHEYLCKLIFITMNNLGEQSKLDFTSESTAYGSTPLLLLLLFCAPALFDSVLLLQTFEIQDEHFLKLNILNLIQRNCYRAKKVPVLFQKNLIVTICISSKAFFKHTMQLVA
jgi:hypothetical protein